MPVFMSELAAVTQHELRRASFVRTFLSGLTTRANILVRKSSCLRSPSLRVLQTFRCRILPVAIHIDGVKMLIGIHTDGTNERDHCKSIRAGKDSDQPWPY